MKSMYKILLIVISLIFWGGCCKSHSHDGHHHGHHHVSHAENLLCGKCGEIKGTDKCCDPNAQKCECGLIHGSPGCCKIEKGDDVKLCTHCGQIKGTDNCCAKDAKSCSSCGLHKGSPGCCKIK
jgi:hypothetical protein